MFSLIKKGIKTVENDGLGVFALRVYNYSLVKLKRLTTKKDPENLEKWKLIKDKYKGERLFVIGNGPSLNKTPLYLLQNEYTMCFNRFNLMYERLGWKPDFYVVIDDLVVKDNAAEINKEALPNVKYAFFPDIHPSNVDFTKYIDHRDNVLWFYADKPAFQADLPNCGHNKTVVNAGLQVAAWLGFTDIYLIGVDMNFDVQQKVKKQNSRNWVAQEHDQNHFDPRYFGKGRKYHNPTVHEMIEKFEEGKKFFDKLGVKIYNAGIGGKLEVFPRVDYISLFKTLSDSQVEDAINNAEALKEAGLTIADIETRAKNLDENGNNGADILVTPADNGAAIVSKMVLEYIPIGPYKNKYYFIKRVSKLTV